MSERTPQEVLKRIRKIALTARKKVNEQLAGSYHSVFKGQGMDFDDVRLYQPGDDVRQIDWNVSARAGEPYIKKFVEERELTVMLLVDTSADKQFGTRNLLKSELAAEVGALLAFSAIENNDRVGLVLFSDEVEHFVPPKKGKRHVLRVIRDILTHQPSGRGKRLEAGLEFLGRIAKRRSIVFLLSDFYQAGWEQPLRVARRRHDVVPLVISDPLEDTLASAGLVTFRDPKTDELIWRYTTPSFLGSFRRHTGKTRSDRERLFRRMKLDYANLSTVDQDYVKVLVQLFKLRARRH